MANVVLLMSDEHNPLFSSVYGHPLIFTPNMTRLAEMGTVFEHAYCPSPLCMPSRSGAFMIRKGSWKLIYCMEGPHQLFNLAKDPQELDNLFAKESEKAAELESELRRICSPEEEDQKAHDFEKRQFEIIKKKWDVH